MSVVVKDFAFSRFVRAIKKSEVEPYILNKIPILSLYLALEEAGFGESLDLLLDLEVDNLKKILDLKLWKGDLLEPETIFLLVDLLNSEDNLDTATRILSVIDPKVYAVLFSRLQFTVDPEVMIKGEGDLLTEAVSVKFPSEFSSDLVDSYSRLFRFLYDANADLFFRLIQVSMSHTGSMLELEAYSDKERRLAEDLPELTYAEERIFTVLETFKVKEILGVSFGEFDNFNPIIEGSTETATSTSEFFFDMLRCEEWDLSYFRALMQGARSGEINIAADISNELIALINCSYVALGQDIRFLYRLISGCCNLGLEHIVRRTPCSLREIYDGLNLGGIYAHGLSLLMRLRRQVNKGVAGEGHSSNLGDMLSAAVNGVNCFRIPLRFDEGITLIRENPHYSCFYSLEQIREVEEMVLNR